MRCKSQSGQAIVEFCVILPLFLIFLVGITELSLVLYDKAVITNASREAARAGILDKTPRLTDAEITTVVNNYCSGRLITFSASSSVTTITRTAANPSASPPTRGTLSVQVTYAYHWLAFPNFVSGAATISLGAATVMQFEN